MKRRCVTFWHVTKMLDIKEDSVTFEPTTFVRVTPQLRSYNSSCHNWQLAQTVECEEMLHQCKLTNLSLLKHPFFSQRTVRDAPPWGTWLRDPPLVKESRKIFKKKGHYPAGFEPTISWLQGMCSTPVLHPRPKGCVCRQWKKLIRPIFLHEDLTWGKT